MKQLDTSGRSKRYIVATIITSLAATAVVAFAIVGATNARAEQFAAQLAAQPATPAVKIVQTPSEAFAPLTITTPKAVTVTAAAVRTATTAKRRVVAKTVKRRAATRARRAAVRSTTKRSTKSDLAQARSVLAGMIAAHPILRGVTVVYGNTHGYQAISYYQSGQIILSPSHTASLSRIISHECWHIIDWRDNGRIDWGENIPPRQ